MTLATIQKIRCPNYYNLNLSLTITSTTLNADGEYISWIFKAPKAGNISKIGIRVTAVTAADPIVVRLETVDAATGYPSGTLIDSPANEAYGTIATPAATTTYWVSLTAAQTVTLNQLIAVKATLTFTDGNLTIGGHYIYGFGCITGFPYMVTYLDSAYAFIMATQNFGIEYDDGSIVYMENCTPAIATGTISFGSNDSPDRRGLRFKFNVPCSISGAMVSFDCDEATNIILYDSDGVTALETISLDKDVRGSTLTQWIHVPFSQSRTLTKDAYYRIVVNPTTTTDVTLPYIDVTDDGANTAISGMPGGANFHYTTINGAPEAEGGWTNTVTRIPLIQLIIDKLDDGASTGGSSPRFGDMTGGLK